MLQILLEVLIHNNHLIKHIMCTYHYLKYRNNLKTSLKDYEDIILGIIGIATVCLILFGLYLLWSRPKFLYMPIYENYEKDSEIEYADDGTGAEMVEGGGRNIS